MPADETYDQVHDLVKKTGHTEHCWCNRAQKDPGFWAQDGWVEHRPLTDGGSPPLRTPRWVWIQGFTSRTKCKANHGVQVIAGCVGCKEVAL